MKLQQKKVLTKAQASKMLLHNKQKLVKQGTGFLRFKNSGDELIENEHISALIINVHEFKTLQTKNISSKIQFCLNIPSEFTQSYEKYLHYHDKQVIPLLYEEHIKNSKIVRLTLEAGKQMNQFVDIINFLQIRQFSIIININFASQNIHNYQKTLNDVSLNILQCQGIFLHSISIEIPLIETQEMISDQVKLKTILAIWRRVIPVSISSIIVKDWMNQGIQKPIFKMHFKKNLGIVWTLQFYSQNQQQCESLGLECIGVQ